jgi:hypothetical protein
MFPKRLRPAHHEVPLLPGTKEDTTFDTVEIEPQLNGRGLGALLP